MMERAERQGAERAGGVPNLTYDLLAMLHEKLESITVVETYLQDARAAGRAEAAALFEQVRDHDRIVVTQLRQLLAWEPAPGLDQSADMPASRGGDLSPSDDDSIVDESSKDSFPASDAPSFTGAAIG